MLLDTGPQFTTKKSFLNQHLFVTTISVVDHIQYPRRVPTPWKKMQHFCIAIVKNNSILSTLPVKRSTHISATDIGLLFIPNMFSG